MYARVIVDIASSAVDKVFDYNLGEYNIEIGTRVLVPFGSRPIEGIVIDKSNTTDVPHDKIKSIIKPIEDFPVITSDQFEIMKFMRQTFHIGSADSLRLFLPSEMRQGKVKDLVTREVRLVSGYEEKLCDLRSTAIKQRESISYLQSVGVENHARLAEKFGASAIKSLKEKEIISITQKVVFRKPYTEITKNTKVVSLTETQQNIVNRVTEKVDKYLLFGVTGSGKTEVYLACMQKALDAGKTGIMLVPEISLTPQVLSILGQGLATKLLFFIVDSHLVKGLMNGREY